MAAHALVAHPDVGLDVAHEAAEVDVAVGVGQGVGDEDLRDMMGREPVPDKVEILAKRHAMPRRGALRACARNDQLDAAVAHAPFLGGVGR